MVALFGTYSHFRPLLVCESEGEREREREREKYRQKKEIQGIHYNIIQMISCVGFVMFFCDIICFCQSENNSQNKFPLMVLGVILMTWSNPLSKTGPPTESPPH